MMVFMMLTGSVCSQLCFLRVAKTLVTFNVKRVVQGKYGSHFIKVVIFQLTFAINRSLQT